MRTYNNIERRKSEDATALEIANKKGLHEVANLLTAATAKEGFTVESDAPSSVALSTHVLDNCYRLRKKYK